jgi:hypothetical protein
VGAGPTALSVDEHVDVAADLAALVEHPAAHLRVRELQLAQETEHCLACQLVLGPSTGEATQGSAHAHESRRPGIFHDHEGIDRSGARY